LPATVKVPLRAEVEVFAATEYEAAPLPEPLAPEVTVIQLAPLVAAHLHEPVVVTLALEVPPAAVAVAEVGATVKLQAVTVTVLWQLAVLPAASVVEQTIGVVPTPNSEPEGGVQDVLYCGVPPVTVGANDTATEPVGDDAIALGTGQEMETGGFPPAIVAVVAIGVLAPLESDTVSVMVYVPVFV
jgi:hypothetical protein